MYINKAQFCKTIFKLKNNFVSLSNDTEYLHFCKGLISKITYYSLKRLLYKLKSLTLIVYMYNSEIKNFAVATFNCWVSLIAFKVWFK